MFALSENGKEEKPVAPGETPSIWKIWVVNDAFLGRKFLKIFGRFTEGIPLGLKMPKNTGVAPYQTDVKMPKNFFAPQKNFWKLNRVKRLLGIQAPVF